MQVGDNFIVAMFGGESLLGFSSNSQLSRFELVDHGDGTYSLRAFGRNFVAAWTDGRVLVNQQDDSRPEARFRVEEVAEGQIALRLSSDLRYYISHPDVITVLQKDEPDEESTFTITAVDPSTDWTRPSIPRLPSYKQ